MTKTAQTKKNEILELQLEEALQMLRLVAQNKRTCLEVEEWLEQNYPSKDSNDEVIFELLKKSFRQNQ